MQIVLTRTISPTHAILVTRLCSGQPSDTERLPDVRDIDYHVQCIAPRRDIYARAAGDSFYLPLISHRAGTSDCG